MLRYLFLLLYASDVRDAYITTMNSLSGKDKMMAMTLTFDPARLKALFNNETYTPTTIDYNFLKEQVENRLIQKVVDLLPKNQKQLLQETKCKKLKN